MCELTEQNKTWRVKSSLLAVNPNLRIFLGAMENTAAFPGVINSAWGNSERKPTGISLFQVPSKEPDRAIWINVLKKYRRKDANDSFEVFL